MREYEPLLHPPPQIKDVKIQNIPYQINLQPHTMFMYFAPFPPEKYTAQKATQNMPKSFIFYAKNSFLWTLYA